LKFSQDKLEKKQEEEAKDQALKIEFEN